MRFTKKKSKRFLAAKARIRLARAMSPLDVKPVKCSLPRKPRADFKITIEARTGERVQLSLIRYNKTFITEGGFRSARQIAAGIEQLIRHLHLPR